MTSDKKRKRDNSLATVGDINIVSAEAHDFPPIVASVHGITIPQIPFKPYTRTIHDSSKKRARSEYLVHGSNPRLDYEGRELSEDSDYHKYYVGIYDPETQTVELHLAPKVDLKPSIKTHRLRDLEVQERGSEFTYDESRTALGKAFGTRKAQSALVSREINKVDVSKMDNSVSNAIVSQVEENTKDMPTTEELGRTMQNERPIPKYNKDATRVEDVYKREDIISEEEWGSIWISGWVKSGNVQTKSTHVNKRATALLEDTSKKHSRELKILSYVASLIDFYLFQQAGKGRLPPIAKCKAKFQSTSPAIIEGFYNNFAETAGNNKYSVSPALEQKILYYLAVLCLIVDDYDVDMFDLRNDLNILPRELAQAFKEVGCSIKELSKTQYTAMKLTKPEAVQHKRAVLKIPLQFPTAPRKRSSARG